MDLLEIQPHELKFIFEPKKPSSCSIQLVNRSDDQYVAFKVKTTSPKKYCVRPNIGVVEPNSKCAITVIMLAQKVAPPDLHCKDKFLVQSTVVPLRTTDEDITSATFSTENGKNIGEKKLRVVLVNAANSPILLPNNRELKKDPCYCYDTSLHKDIEPNGIENIPPPQKLDDGVLKSQTTTNMEDLKTVKDEESKPAVDAGELESVEDAVEPKLVKDFEELKSKLYIADSKLREANHKITKLSDERNIANKEKDLLKQEIVLRMTKMKRIQMGFPLLYVFMVALISVGFGYIIHP